MFERAKSILIAVLFFIAIGAYFYGVKVGEDKTPQVVYVEKQVEKKSLEASAANLKLQVKPAKKPGAVPSISLTADSLDLKAAQEIGHEIAFALDDKKPEWGWGAGAMKQDKEYLAQLHGAYRLVGDIYLLGNLEINTDLKLERYGGSLLFLQ